jgi:hypothetical protein
MALTPIEEADMVGIVIRSSKTYLGISNCHHLDLWADSDSSVVEWLCRSVEIFDGYRRFHFSGGQSLRLVS